MTFANPKLTNIEHAYEVFSKSYAYHILTHRALTGVGAGLLEWGVTSPSEAVYVCLLVFNQSGDGLASFSGAYRTRKSFG